MGGFEKLFDFIIKGSIDATILGLVILVIRFFLKEKVSPKVIYSLWIIVLLKFLMPYGPKSSLSIYSMVNKSVESYFTQSSSKDESINEISSDERGNNSSFLENNINFNKENIESKVIKSNEVINGNQEMLKGIGSFSWLIIVISLGSYGFFSYIKLKNLGKETNNKIYKKVLKEILEKNNIRRKVIIVESDLVSSPSIYGVFNPKIIMPNDLKVKLDEEEIKYIFLHEIMHLKNKHTLIAIIAVIIRIIHWFNPFIYVFLKVMNIDCELACDYDALKRLNKDKNIKYGNTILKIIENIKNRRRLIATTSMGISKKEVKGRIEMIIKNKKFGRRSIVIGSVVLVGVSVIGLTSQITKGDDRLVSKDEKGTISTSEKILIYENAESKELNKESKNIEKILKEYINALNNRDLDYISNLVSMNFYEVKENDVTQLTYLSGNKLGNVKSIEIEELIRTNKISVFVRCENKSEVFTLIKEDNQWKIDAIDSVSRNIDHRKEEKVAESKINDYLREKNFKAQVNSAMGGILRLPASFNEVKRDVKVGELIKEFNELSIKNGYDFSNYLNEEVYFKSIDLEDNKSIKTIIAMVKDEKVIGLFPCDELNSEKFRGLINIIGE